MLASESRRVKDSIINRPLFSNVSVASNCESSAKPVTSVTVGREGRRSPRDQNPTRRPADSVLARLEREHHAPNALLATTQKVLDSLRQFVMSHHIVTIPPSDPTHVVETPAFMRSTTVASMNTPSPFETATVNAY